MVCEQHRGGCLCRGRDDGRTEDGRVLVQAEVELQT